ncbi:hypothetical protein AVEN_200139-1 [Araneus ventricosus]|uniref:Uncharacterized protein n=1 Tax=Araneus ventricosus TaxID=182803 RepID=A0A4Y2N7B6_ARAVE|nr:hypothetical protein AVEN_200139-1 [Araneus ventricosus]
MVSLKKQTLFDIWRVNKDSNSIYNFVIETLNLRDCKDDIKVSVTNTVKSFCVHLKNKWRKRSSSLKTFSCKNSNWLQNNIIFDETVVKEATIRLPELLNWWNPSSTPRGRPTKDFKGSSIKSGKRKVSSIIQDVNSPEQLDFPLTSFSRKTRRCRNRKVSKFGPK